MILLDTHVVFWLAFDSDRISRPAQAAIREGRRKGVRPAISAISLYEIARSVERGRMKLDASLELFIDSIYALFEIRNINREIALVAARLPANFPSDPADRLIAATAMVDGVPLLTADKNILRSRAVKTIW